MNIPLISGLTTAYKRTLIAELEQSVAAIYGPRTPKKSYSPPRRNPNIKKKEGTTTKMKVKITIRVIVLVIRSCRFNAARAALFPIDDNRFLFT